LESNLDFANEALRVLLAESPAHYLHIARALRRAPGRYTVGGERLFVTTDGEAIHVNPNEPRGKTAIDAQISAQDVVKLLDGAVMLDILLAQERLIVFADAPTLLNVGDAVCVFLDCAVANHNLRTLFERYRAWVNSSSSSI
jgi:hypothetical protein